MKATRRLLAILAFAIAFSAAADSHTPLDTPVESLLYHIRLKAPKNRNLRFTVYWDSTSVDLDIEPPTHDDFYPSECSYIIRHGATAIEKGKKEFVYKGKGDAAFSAVLSVDRSGAELSLGTDAASFAIPISFDREKPSCIGYKCAGNAEEITNLLITKGTEKRRISNFASIDSLKSRIAASADIYEGIWSYLDRDIDRSKADIGAFYTLATIANDHGGYDIVYLGGENNYSFPWKPLDIKGELIRTPFTDNFDLYWVSADGLTLRHDTSATFEAGRSVMRLNFPLLGSSMRFRRNPNR